MSSSMKEAFTKAGLEVKEPSRREKMARVALKFLKGVEASDTEGMTEEEKKEEFALLVEMQSVPFLQSVALSDAQKLLEGGGL